MARLNINCPKCGATLRGVTTDMVGDIGVCPKCQAEFEIQIESCPQPTPSPKSEQQAESSSQLTSSVKEQALGEATKPVARFNAGGVFPGFVASSGAVLGIFFEGFAPGKGGLIRLLPLAVFMIAWGGYANSVSESIESLVKHGLYRRSFWVTLLSNVTAIAVALGICSIALLAMGEDLETGKAGYMDRFVWSAWALIASYFAYMAPGWLIALRSRKRTREQRAEPKDEGERG